jgi:hypothetical protein
MQYALKPATATSAEPAMSAELADNFAAESWAKTWAKSNAQSDAYTLERVGGGFKARLFRTIAGQWYLTPSA